MAIKKSKGGGAKLSRSEIVTVRFDPKVRYLVELAARKHRRTVSSFIEWAVELSFKQVGLLDASPEHVIPLTVRDMAEVLWDIDEADRFVTLAIRLPDLLVHEEQILWKLIYENGFLWKGRFGPRGEWDYTVQHASLIKSRLRNHFATFKSVAAGDLPHSALPTWRKKGPPSADEDGDTENQTE
jgi:hypothetical protein